jgi:L-glutamine-phosphate cytidylyltransferase
MGDLTAAQPKCLLRLHGHRLIDWQLTALRAAGLRKIAIVRGYRADLLDLGLPGFTNPRWDTTSSVASLLAADAWLREESCIVSYADLVYDARTVVALAATPGDLAISYDPDWLPLWRARFADPLADAETFRIDQHGTLVEIGARARHIDEIQGQYMGLVKCAPAGWHRIAAYADACEAPERDRLDVTAVLRGLLAEGMTIATVPCIGRWYEVDSATDLAAYATMPAIGAAPL